MGLSGIIIVLGLLGAVLFWLLDRHEQRRAANDKPRHSALRLIFGAMGLLVMLFSGGCMALFLYDLAANRSGQNYVTWEAIAIIGGIPFVIGLLIWWAAMRRANPAA